MLQPITPPPTITTWARLGKSVGMSRPFLVVMITAITSTGCPRWSRHVPGGDGGGRAGSLGGCRRGAGRVPAARVGGSCEGGDMVIRLGSTVINCADLERMTRFWTG